MGHLVLLVAGGVTAIVAVFAMMTQSSVKHALVWSTNAQMGFMLFEIALGAYTLALLHLLAHSLYKAHSLLASGRAVKATAVYFSGRPGASQLVLAGVASGLAAAILWMLPDLVEGKAILAALLVLAVAASVLGLPSGSTARARLLVVVMAISLVPLYGLLHLVLGPSVAGADNFVLWPAATVVAWVMLGLLAGMSLLVLFRPDWAWLQRLNLPLSQGLYLDQPFERVTRRWARQWLQGARKRRKSPLRSVIGRIFMNSTLRVPDVDQKQAVDQVAMACKRIAPSWPLDRWIAVNPWWGHRHQGIEEAAIELVSRRGQGMLMAPEFYLEAWHGGRIREGDLIAAARAQG